MLVKERVHVSDRILMAIRAGVGKVSKEILSSWDKPVHEVTGWVDLVMRERGKIVPGSHRTGRNIWTTTGAEYLVLRMSLDPTAAPSKLPYRVDTMAYIGVGTGSQVESSSVMRLVNPIAFSGGTFLAPLSAVEDTSFPLLPTRTTVRYRRLFTESEITLTAGSVVDVSEMGLFTDGDPATARASGARKTELTYAIEQNPLAYKSIEPVRKSDALELEVNWEIRL